MKDGEATEQASSTDATYGDDEVIMTCMPKLRRIGDLAAVAKSLDGSALAAAARSVLEQKSAYEETTAGFSQS
jgi:hypothetical protein